MSLVRFRSEAPVKETQQGFQYAAVAHLVERHLAKVEVASSSLVGRSKKQQKIISRFSAHMVTWPSGKAKVCKTFIHQFKSGRHLHKPVIKKMSQAFFFAVSSKIDDFANRFLDTVLQCCPTILGRFAHLDAHFSCRFLEFGRGGGNFLRKNRINPAVFRMFSISSQPIFRWLRGFFAFPGSFQFLFRFSILYLL